MGDIGGVGWGGDGLVGPGGVGVPGSVGVGAEAENEHQLESMCYGAGQWHTHGPLTWRHGC